MNVCSLMRPRVAIFIWLAISSVVEAQTVGVVLKPAGATLIRADSKAETPARPGDLLFAGDRLRTRDMAASFIYCPQKQSTTLAPGSDAVLSASGIRVTAGQIASRTPIASCLVPQMVRVTTASSQHYGTTIVRGESEILTAKLRSMPEAQRSAFLAEWKTVESALYKDPENKPLQEQALAVLKKYGIPEQVLDEVVGVAPSPSLKLWRGLESLVAGQDPHAARILAAAPQAARALYRELLFDAVNVAMFDAVPLSPNAGAARSMLERYEPGSAQLEKRLAELKTNRNTKFGDSTPLGAFLDEYIAASASQKADRMQEVLESALPLGMELATAKCWLELAAQTLRDGKPDEARALLQLAATVWRVWDYKPGIALAMYWSGEIDASQGRLEIAADAYEQAAEISAGFPQMQRLRQDTAAALAKMKNAKPATHTSVAATPATKVERPVDPNLEAGRQLVASLKLDQSADQPLLASAGYDRAATVLIAVMGRGQDVNATPREWAEMHRAIAGLTELFIAKGELFKASMYAGFQELYYRNDEGDYEAALAAGKEALRLMEQSPNKETAYIYWKNIGEDLIRLGRLDEALDALYQAQRLTADPTNTIRAIIWREIVDGEVARKNLEAARRECAAFVRQAIPAAPALFRGRAKLAEAFLNAEGGHYDQALNSIREARKEVAGDPKEADFGLEVANELLSVVVTAMHSIPYAQAMELGRRADKEFPDLPFPVSPIARQAMDYRRRLAGEFDALLREQTANLQAARAAKNVYGQIEILRTLAAIYAYANSTQQGITLLEDALALEKSMLPSSGVPDNAGSQYSYFRLLASLGDAYAHNQEPRKAEKCFDEVLRGIDSIAEGTARSRLTRLYGEAILGKALVAEVDHDYDRARQLLKEALNAPPTGPARFTRSDVQLQFARLERNLNQQPLEAVRYYDDAIQEFRGAKDTRDEISTRLQLARYLAVEAAQRVPDSQTRASENLKLASAAASSIEFADAQWRVRFLEGIVAENANQNDKAIELYKQAVNKLDQIRAGLSQQEQRQAFMDNESIQELYRRLIALLTKEGRQQQAWEYLERGKARSFLEMLQGRRFRAASTRGSDKELEDLERQIINLRAQVGPATASALRGVGRNPSLLYSQVRDLEARFAVARQRAALEGSRAGQELSLRPLSIAEVQSKLGAGTTLVEYAVFEDKLAAFVISREQVEQVVWPAKIAELKGGIKHARELLGRPDSGEDLNKTLETLSSSLIRPVLAKLPGNTHTLVIVPADFLNYLPFQVLSGADGHALVERYAVAYLPSASSLAFLGSVDKLSGGVFLGAIGSVRADGMSPLPGTLIEVKDIAKAIPQAQIAVEKSFTYDRLRQALLEDQTVHMATHGVVNEDAPLFDAVITSPADQQPSRFSLYELTDMKLKARMIVMSACNTGLGELRRGDEITGLSRMFLQAGADTVVASLWSVSDRATALLMKGFYERLEKGEAPAEALRAASLEVRKTYPHPYYWSPFIVNGAR